MQEAGTDLCNAVINGDTGLLKRLLDHGVDPNSADYDLRTPLHIASAEGFLLVSKILVEHGADVMARDRCATAQHSVEQHRAVQCYVYSAICTVSSV